MSVSGLCQICQERPATDRCENCGAMVCEAHFDRPLGLCTDCAATARRGGAGGDTEINGL